MYAPYHVLCSQIYWFTTGMLSGMDYPTGKKNRASTGMGKNSNPHAGMGFLRVGVRGPLAGLFQVPLHWLLQNPCQTPNKKTEDILQFVLRR
jgi:hypothetical protein